MACGWDIASRRGVEGERSDVRGERRAGEQRRHAVPGEAANIAQLNLTLEGSMGKRTKFQVDSKPQLRVAEATSSDGTTAKVAVLSLELNEDSVLLEDVAFDDQKRRANVQDPRRGRAPRPASRWLYV